jgi:hypothetical protein
MPVMATETLSLFGPLASVNPALEQAAARGPRPDPQTDPHLHAARRLSRQIRRTVDGSPQQTRAAHLICRHLVAMLHADTTHPNRPSHVDR